VVVVKDRRPIQGLENSNLTTTETALLGSA